MQAFIRGLNHLDVADLVRAHPDMMKEVFVYKSTMLTAKQFLALVISSRPDGDTTFKCAKAFDYFVDNLEKKNDQGIWLIKNPI